MSLLLLFNRTTGNPSTGVVYSANDTYLVVSATGPDTLDFHIDDVKTFTLKDKQGIFQGSVNYPLVVKSSDFTITKDHMVVLGNAASGNVTFTLPSTIASLSGRYYEIKKIDSSNNKVTVASTANIDGSTNQDILFQYDAIQVVASSSSWNIVQEINELCR